MEYRVLGPLEVLDARGNKLRLGGARQQSVLASLLLRAERTVALERLVDELWEKPPLTAARTVQAYISRLRHELPAGTIESRPGGYALLLNGDRLDLRAFEDAAEEGRVALASGDYERAAWLLGQALALWRGPALAGLASDGLRREAERLEELRLQVVENRLEAELGRGHHREVVPELRALVSEHPFRERPRAQLMLALYRAGMSREALALYRQTRRLLVEELGMEPGQELRDLERAILRNDPTLTLPSVSRSNLLVQPTPLIGRERELSEVLALLGKKRLLTLTGPGGVGKTRLAQQAASELVDKFRDGVWFVSLAAAREPEVVAPTVAQTLELKEPQTLEQHLREKQLLLVLDNFDRLVKAAPQLAELLAKASGVKLLVTSREPLHLAGEQEYRVPPLTDREAERLFRERVREAKPDFRPDKYVPVICRRLDNLPLALELAAARVKVMTTKALLARLDQRLPLLTGGPRCQPERQRTLRATIEWSYDLLTDEEKHLFARLAVFAGGFTLEAAEAVCEAKLDTLQALVEKSLIYQGPEERFFMLETVREHALERLALSGEEAFLRRRHAYHFAAVAADLRDRFHTSDTFEARASMRADLHNFRLALDWTYGPPSVTGLGFELHRMRMQLLAAMPWSRSTGGAAGAT